MTAIDIVANLVSCGLSNGSTNDSADKPADDCPHSGKQRGSDGRADLRADVTACSATDGADPLLASCGCDVIYVDGHASHSRTFGNPSEVLRTSQVISPFGDWLVVIPCQGSGVCIEVIAVECIRGIEVS